MQILKNAAISLEHSSKQPYRLKMLFRSIAIAIGGIHTWAAVVNYSMNEDGISYLDIGDAYFRGDWQAAINSVWSPMYSWILGAVMWIVKPSMQWEFPLVQIVNFAIYMVALICFEFFWRQVTNYHWYNAGDFGEDSILRLPDWAMWAMGYLIFVISSLHLIEIWAVTPDMLMSGFVYLASGIILRLRMTSISLLQFVLLGLVLGLGYLAKAVMFPLAFFFLVVAFFSVKESKRAALGVGCALLVFALIAGPFIAMISHAKGNLTFGDAGKLTYAKHVNGVQYPHWIGDRHGNGTPAHPSRKIFDSPPIYEFGAPIAGTYPISHDPAYWYEGVVARFDLKNQLNMLLTSMLFYFDLFFYQQAGLLFGIIMLFMFRLRRPLNTRGLVLKYGLIIPSVVAFGFYALVTAVGRYIGVFVVLFWSDLLSNVRLPDNQINRKLASLLPIIMVIFLLLNIVAFNFEGLRTLTGGGNRQQLAVKKYRSPSWPGEVAEALYRNGMKSGDKVAIVGYAFDAYWARLGRFKIVAEMLGWEADPFWLGSPSFQSRIIDAFRSTGASAIIAEDVPSYARINGWRQIKDTNHFVYLFGDR